MAWRTPEEGCSPVPASYVVDGHGMGMPVGVAQFPCPIATMLGLGDRQTRERLLQAIENAVRLRKPDIMLWRARNHVLGCIIEVRPARETGSAVVTISNLDDPVRTLSADLLMRLLGLSMAEAQVAIALYDGEELAEIAASRRVQLETVRGQVKDLLHKLNLPNQKRLGILLSRIALSPLLVRGDPPHGGWQSRSAKI